MKPGITVLFVFLSVCGAQSADRYVDKDNTHAMAFPFESWLTATTNIQTAVDAAEEGDTIWIADGVYTPASEIVVSNNVHLRGLAGPLFTIVDGGGEHRCLHIIGSTNTVSGITFRNGTEYSEPGGGIYCDGGLVTASNCVFENNLGDAGGGGLYNGDAYNCVFKNNLAGDDGGGLYSGLAVDCTFVSNRTFGTGGAIYHGEAVRCVIMGNDGSALINSDATDCTFMQNSSDQEGGAMVGGVAGNCTFVHNRASFFGGAIAHVSATDCRILGNQTDVWYKNNGGGGASDCVLTNCLIENNSCVWEGEGGGVRGGSAVNCIITGNGASWGGGTCGSTNHNCIISGNRTDLHGSGGGVEGGLSVNCTIVGNSAESLGATAFEGVGYNCVVINNFNDERFLPNCRRGTLYSSCCPDVVDGVNGNTTNAPRFLSDYRLAFDSPCIDAGSNEVVSVGVDLDGNPRIVNGRVDMGAYEYNPVMTDSDHDGIDDAWEAIYFSCATGCVSSGNADDDPGLNREEYIAGTDPTNAYSFFRISAAEAGPEGFVVRWEAAAGRLYGVDWSPGLSTGFQTLEQGIPYPVSCYTDRLHNTERSGFYYVNVKRQQDNP